MSESAEQVKVVTWFRIQYPYHVIISIPNGAWLAGSGRQRFAQAGKLKKTGMMPGVSDLFICVPCGKYGGMWLEMKDRGKKKSSLTPAQREWIGLMNSQGYYADWAAGFEEARDKIKEYLGNN